MLRSGAARALVLVLGCVASACGGDDGGGGDGDADAAADAAGSPDALVIAAGRVAITGAGITGANGRIVLASVTSSGGGPSLGGVCVAVTSDPMSFMAVARTPAEGNPCDLGDEVVFADGTYDVAAGIYTPGNQTPDLCSDTTVTVAGTGEVTLPAFGACP